MIKNNPDFWKKALLPVGASIREVIANLEVSGLQIALVVSENGVLLGTLTDGDIRRAFLNGANLESNADDILNRHPLVVPPGIERSHILQIMQTNKIHQLPIVKEGGVVDGLYLWGEIDSSECVDNFMLIMAGGRGARLYPHTENCPKPMVDVGGKPMLEHIIEHAKSEGFRNFLISLHYLPEVIVKYFGDGGRWGVNIDYLLEDSPLGTAGSLSLIKSVPSAPFIVTNGDVLTNISYRNILNYHIKNQSSATMVVRHHEIQNQFGVVKVSGIEIEGFEEKPIYRSQINAGIYALNPDVLNLLDCGQACDMPSLFDRVKSHGLKAIVFPMHESWLDVGRPEDLIQANIHGEPVKNARKF